MVSMRAGYAIDLLSKVRVRGCLGDGVTAWLVIRVKTSPLVSIWVMFILKMGLLAD